MADIRETLHAPEQVNLHTHSWYCGHGSGELSEYVAVAKSLGLTALGLSEHCPVPDERWRRSRMAYAQIDTYMHQARTLQSEERDIRILCGFECEHDPRYTRWYDENLVQNNYVDFLNFGVHYIEGPDGKETFLRNLPPTKQWLHRYTDMYIDGLQSGLYLFGAHPDLFGMFYTDWDEEAISCSKSLLSCAESVGIPLEINGYGFRKPAIQTAEGKRLQYPMQRFWDLASTYAVKVVINSDAHVPGDLELASVGAFEFARKSDIVVSGWYIGEDSGGKLSVRIA